MMQEPINLALVEAHHKAVSNFYRNYHEALNIFLVKNQIPSPIAAFLFYDYEKQMYDYHNIEIKQFLNSSSDKLALFRILKAMSDGKGGLSPHAEVLAFILNTPMVTIDQEGKEINDLVFTLETKISFKCKVFEIISEDRNEYGMQVKKLRFSKEKTKFYTSQKGEMFFFTYIVREHRWMN